MSKLPLICIDDYKKYAKEQLGQYAGLIMNGADDSITANDNEQAYKRYLILPRVLNTAPNINLSTTILGQLTSFPVCASPSAYHSLVNKSGELASARGVTSLGTMFVLSQLSDHKIEDVARVIGGEGNSLLLAQLSFLADYTHPTCGELSSAVPSIRDLPIFPSGLITSKKLRNEIFLDSSLSWSRIHALRQHTSLPIIAKGIITVLIYVTEADAISAIEEGHVDAIIVSNHGGRQLDSVPATVCSVFLLQLINVKKHGVMPI